jgi:hypothetical protein
VNVVGSEEKAPSWLLVSTLVFLAILTALQAFIEIKKYLVSVEN